MSNQEWVMEPVAWVTADTVDGQTVNGKPRRIWWENNEGVGMPIYAAPQPAEQAVEQSVIAGALFDFLGFLTTRDSNTTFGATSLASPAVDLLSDWAETRSLALDDADVSNWQSRISAALATQPAAEQSVPGEVERPVAFVQYDSPIKGHTEFMRYEPWMDDGLSTGWIPLYSSQLAARDAGEVRAVQQSNPSPEQVEPSGAVDEEFTTGDTYPAGDCDIFEAGIHHKQASGDQWQQRIIVYGDSAADAEALRDRVLASLADAALIRLTDYEALQVKCEEELFRVRQDRDTHFGELMRAIEQVDALKAECEKLRKDAARYRWLLKHYGEFHGDRTLAALALRHGNLDAAIDAALSQSKAQPAPET